MRIVIAGSGVIGLLTAVRCVSAGHEVVLADQAGIPYPGAASYDRHRTVRALHAGEPALTAAAVAAHHRWAGLAELLATRFYEQTGVLHVLPRERLRAAVTALTRAGSQAVVMDGAGLVARYPQVRFEPGASAVLETLAGVLRADRLLAACADWLLGQRRAQLLPHHRVTGVDPSRTALRLAGGGWLTGDAVLLATGPWSRELLPPAFARRLTLHRQSLLYCQVPPHAAAAWSGAPPMISLGPAGGAWLVPPVAGTPLKLSAGTACRVVDGVGDGVTPARWRDHLVEVFAGVLPGFEAGWLVDTRDCHYLAGQPAGGPRLAVLAERVLSFAACGGSSFKFAPLIAGYLADRLTCSGEAGPAPAPLDGRIVRLPSSVAAA
jgi:glycine/D-amino acid oxidase-like deaminating enzyme